MALVAATTTGAVALAIGVALALANNGGPTEKPSANQAQSPTGHGSKSEASIAAQNPAPSRSASAIPGQPDVPPPLPRSLVGYSGRLLGQSLTWFQSLRIPASSAQWSGGGLWAAIAGPGCADGVGHGVSASAGWSTDPARGGATFEGCDGADLVAAATAPGQAATDKVTWTFTPGVDVSDCAVFAHNATSPANRAYGDYSLPGHAGQFPMAGTSHAGEWIELGTERPAPDGTVTATVANDQVGGAQHPVGPTVTAAQVVAVCGADPA